MTMRDDLIHQRDNGFITESEFTTKMREREFVIWSKFGLWRSITVDELMTGNVVMHDDPVADVDKLGYCLTFIDCEPVAVLAEYPEDDAPEAVNEWLAQSPDWEAETE